MQLWMLPWIWEDDLNASPLVGAPTAQSIFVEQIELALLTKLDKRLDKLKSRQPALAACITVANKLPLAWKYLVLACGLSWQEVFSSETAKGDQSFPMGGEVLGC